MIVKKSIQLWDHIPDLAELREKAVPECDSTIETFQDGTDLDVYLRYTGLRFYTNGRDFSKDERNIKSEMKYTITQDKVFFPEYDIPDKDHFILI